MPKVSVIIPSYNYAQFLPECIRSIFSQTFKDWEALIVDDGSSDNTEEVAAKLVALNPQRVKYFRTVNKGVTHARNFAVENASGEYILPLDADDILTPDSLKEFVRCLDENPDVGFAYSALQNFGKDESVWEPGLYSKERLIWENLAACTSMWRRKFYEQGMRYRNVIFEDWDLWLQIAALGFEGKYIPKVLFKYRIHHSGRNTINKNRYMQSLLEEIKYNPSLYDQGLQAWCSNSMINFPDCLNKPSVIFLPKPGTQEFSNFNGALSEIARKYISEGHFAVAIGDYKNTFDFLPGLILISFKDSPSIEEQIKREIYKLGKEAIVFNLHGSEINPYIESVNNVIQVVNEAKIPAQQPVRKIDSSKLPKISVITVSFNQAEFIKENIESVLAQNYPNFEHIVIDGGSTDGTIEILKSYPHLNWVSEPDRGQTHALNKGFSKAAGDIICWLNSDDYIPKDVFFEVESKLRNSSIVIGACQVTGKHGEHKEFVPNVPRTWFDVLKYWIFYSSPAQPSIFFRKEVLSDFKRNDGSYLDEGLDFCMDYEFWLRIGEKYPLTTYTPKILSYCRTYDTNKTGLDMDSVYREMSRVFSRYSKIKSGAERALSFVVPITSTEGKVFETLDSIASQSLSDSEILIVDYSEDTKSAKKNRRAILDYEKKLQFINVRYLRSLSTNFVEAVNHGISEAGAEFAVLLSPGTTVGKDFCKDAKNLFRHDIISLALPIKDSEKFSMLIKRMPQGPALLDIQNIFSCPWIAPCFVVRKVAWLEVQGIKNLTTDTFIVPSLIISLMNKGWQISVDNKLEFYVSADTEIISKDQKVSELSGYFAANIITQIVEDEDEFSRLRRKHGFGLSFSEEIIKNSKEVSEQTKDQIIL